MIIEIFVFYIQLINRKLVFVSVYLYPNKTVCRRRHLTSHEVASLVSVTSEASESVFYMGIDRLTQIPTYVRETSNNKERNNTYESVFNSCRWSHF